MNLNKKATQSVRFREMDAVAAMTALKSWSSCKSLLVLYSVCIGKKINTLKKDISGEKKTFRCLIFDLIIRKQ